MRSSSSGFLLLLVGILAAVGFLSGQLDRWMAWLFQPPGSAAPASATSGASSSLPPSQTNQSVGGGVQATAAPAPAGNRRATSSA